MSYLLYYKLNGKADSSAVVLQGTWAGTVCGRVISHQRSNVMKHFQKWKSKLKVPRSEHLKSEHLTLGIWSLIGLDRDMGLMCVCCWPHRLSELQTFFYLNSWSHRCDLGFLLVAPLRNVVALSSPVLETSLCCHRVCPAEQVSTRLSAPQTLFTIAGKTSPSSQHQTGKYGIHPCRSFTKSWTICAEAGWSCSGGSLLRHWSFL